MLIRTLDCGQTLQKDLEMRIGNMYKARAELLLRGWPSVAAWAEAHGFLPVTVRRTIYDWGERDEAPHGGMGRQIMQDLERELSENLPEAVGQ